jgi:putative salt-induced outer membrane protein
MLVAAGMLVPCVALGTEWKPSGELGYVMTSGNSETSSLNAKVALQGEGTWVHDYYALVLRGETDDETTAQRYEVAGKSGYKFSERRYVFGSVRYENDDFAPFDYQVTGAGGLGWYALKSDATTWLFEVGPGARRSELVTGESETDFVGRGLMDLRHALTGTTQLIETLLVETGSSNTFLQNDLGVAVSISKSLALKAALQVRRNSETPPGVDRTDTLTTINVVWTPGA